MLFSIYIIFILFLSNKLLCEVIRQMSKSPNKIDFHLNETVILTCELQETKKLIVPLFRKDKIMLAEDCRVFNHAKYHLDCEKFMRENRSILELKFTIKHLEWTDRGVWECIYNQNRKGVHIDIKVPAKFEKLEIEPIKPVDSIKPTDNTGPEYQLLNSKNNYILKGRGSRTNPYNLREGLALKVTCNSSCSYPPTHHQWSFANVSHGPVNIDLTSPKIEKPCSSVNSEGMNSSHSVVTVNCTALKMVGANEIVCQSDSDKTRIYVLCPGGERPWELTMGEIIGLATSVGIISLLIFFLCLMVKRSRSAYRNPPETNANTYNYGVKV